MPAVEVLSRYYSPRTFVQSFSNLNLTESSLRWILCHRATHGLEASSTIKKLGPRRILIDADRFVAWLNRDAQGETTSQNLRCPPEVSLRAIFNYGCDGEYYGSVEY